MRLRSSGGMSSRKERLIGRTSRVAAVGSGVVVVGERGDGATASLVWCEPDGIMASGRDSVVED